MATFLISTTGSDVTLADLGNITFTDPVANYVLSDEYTLEQLRDSEDLRTAIDATDLTASLDGVSITTGALFDSVMVDFLNDRVATNESDIATIQTDIEEVDLHRGRRWTEVLTIAVSTAVPPTEVLGNYYAIDFSGATNAAWDGAAQGDVVYFNGTTWDAFTPRKGDVISNAADDLDYKRNTSSWDTQAAANKKTYTFSAGENGNLNSDQDLLRTGRIFTNQSPFIAPITGAIWGISVASRQGTSETFDVQIIINGTVQHTQAVTASDKSFSSALSVAVTAGDEVRLRFIAGVSGTVKDVGVEVYGIEA